MEAQGKIRDDNLSYREMCDLEGIQTLQRGMNFRLRPSYSVILLSQRSNAPYRDRVHDDGITIEYEGQHVPRHPGVWSLKGYFDLIQYKIVDDGQRKVFRYILRLPDRVAVDTRRTEDPAHTRLIP